MATITETAIDRVARLEISEVSEKRMESLEIAHAAGISDKVFSAIAGATRLRKQSTIVLPSLRYESLSRGKGWCRLGNGDSATWGDRVDGGYEVGPGRWIVGASDGFSRKDSRDWSVKHVTVGDAVWTVAN